MPGCPLSCRTPTAWCSTPSTALTPSAKVRFCFPRSQGTRMESLVACGFEARGLCRFGTGPRHEAPGDRRLLSVLFRVSHIGGSHVSGQHLHHGEGLQPTHQEADGEEAQPHS